MKADFFLCSLKRWLVHCPQCPSIPLNPTRTHRHTEHGIQKAQSVSPPLGLASQPCQVTCWVVWCCARPSVGSQPWACLRSLTSAPLGLHLRQQDGAELLVTAADGSWVPQSWAGLCSPLLTCLCQHYSIGFPIFFIKKKYIYIYIVKIHKTLTCIL